MKLASLCAGSALVVTGLAFPLTSSAQLTVQSGYELFQTQASGTSFPGLGSLMGVPLGTFNFGSGPVNTGDTDTIIQRLTTATVANAGDSTTVNLKVNALQLETTAQVNFMNLGLNNYFITLDPNTASTGSMTLTFGGPGGGTFSSSLDLTLDIHSGALNGPVVDTETLMLQNNNEVWGRTPPPGSVLINGVDYLLNGTDTSADFWPGLQIVQNPPSLPSAADDLTPATVPDGASTLGLLLASATILFATRRRLLDLTP